MAHTNQVLHEGIKQQTSTLLIPHLPNQFEQQPHWDRGANDLTQYIKIMFEGFLHSSVLDPMASEQQITRNVNRPAILALKLPIRKLSFQTADERVTKINQNARWGHYN